ncbi:hypothetical protein AUC71_15780 [Methyloceanibacter marginalis]|uniref:Uncharacterized protein n=1 Tax=Methyloceanibacter marginalis TaxID=1774971 RepID=A0A1E3W982_9HYPH|nr:hypothetical protein AUC71_15780 [Methyloceanibacter marginalis]
MRAACNLEPALNAFAGLGLSGDDEGGLIEGAVVVAARIGLFAFDPTSEAIAGCAESKAPTPSMAARSIVRVVPSVLWVMASSQLRAVRVPAGETSPLDYPSQS